MTDQTQAQFDREVAEYAAMGIDPAAEIAEMISSPARSLHRSVTLTPAGLAAAARQDDRDLITRARAIADARTTDQLRTAICDAYPFHAQAMKATRDQDVYAYANGVMSEVLRELAHLAEREINRNA
jgi:hypothetical protein